MAEQPTTKHQGWRTERVADDEVQVYPLEDLITHDLTEDRCVCGPRNELVTRDGDRDAWVHVHHSLDGREAFE